jgi:hypothetical protein
MKTGNELARDDLALLKLVLACYDDLSDFEQKAFSAFQHRLREKHKKGIDVGLKDEQRRWVSDVAKRLDIVEPAANLVSRGLVPRGKDVPVPPVLMNRPLKPPGR